MSNKVFDSYVLHIEQRTLDRLNEIRDLKIKLSGKAFDFDKLVYLSLGRYLTAIRYEDKRRQYED